MVADVAVVVGVAVVIWAVHAVTDVLDLAFRVIILVIVDCCCLIVGLLVSLLFESLVWLSGYLLVWLVFELLGCLFVYWFGCCLNCLFDC